ncbi:MAG: TonB-dependent receptor [Gammaproteobacteria bacterium]|nr:TonB-dependent receptor [Gammaproteobacteria bacterium]
MSDLRNKLLAFASLVLLIVGSRDVAAQQQADALDEIVVTATRMETALRHTARSISVVSKERIQNATQQLALDEALAGVPGLYMQNRYNFAQDLRISLRGFGARSSFGIRGIRVFVDDIPETLPDGQAQVDSIDIGSASRIEVLRGPASSLFGNASGGVISVTSELGNTEPFVEGRLAGGDYGYRKLQLKSAGDLRRFDYLVNLSGQELDGYREHSRAESTLLNSKFGFDITGNDRLVLSFNHSDQPVADDPGGINAAQAAVDRRSARAQNVDFDAGEELSQQRMGLVYNRKLPGGSLMLRNYYVWRDFANKLPFVGGGAVDLERFFYGLGVQYVSAGLANSGLSFTVGLDVDRQDDDRLRFDNNMGNLGDLVFEQNERVNSSGIYLQASYRMADRWALRAGLRYDDLEYDVRDDFLIDGNDSGKLGFNELSPSLGLSFDSGPATLFVSYSRSFETPTTTELANPDGSGGFNAALEAQTADNVELGLRGTASSLVYELAIFRIDLQNELIPFELAGQPGRTFFANAGSSTRTGVESSLGWTADNGFGVGLSYTWSDFTFDDFVDDNGNDFAGNRLPGVPEHFGYLSLSYATENGFSALAEAVYTGSVYANNSNATRVASHVVTNLRVGYEFSSGRWRVQPYIGINNLLEEEYNSNIRINAFGARFFEPAPERNYYAGVVVGFEPR